MNENRRKSNKFRFLENISEISDLRGVERGAVLEYSNAARKHFVKQGFRLMRKQSGFAFLRNGFHTYECSHSSVDQIEINKESKTSWSIVLKVQNLFLKLSNRFVLI